MLLLGSLLILLAWLRVIEGPRTDKDAEAKSLARRLWELTHPSRKP